MNQTKTRLNLEFHPLTPDRWADFEQLFGERGAVGGCWCMWWRLKGSEYERQKGEGNRHAMAATVESGDVPGILAYDAGVPVGWCSVAPRDRFGRLNRSPNLKAVDETPVWSVVCFFIHKDYREQGLSAALLRAAVAYVRQRGGAVVEGYPVVPKKDEVPTIFAYTGFVSTFEQAGFVEVERRSETRPIMRYYIEEG